MGCHFLLQGIFPTQGSSPRLLCLLRWQTGSSPPGKPHVKFLLYSQVPQLHMYIHVSTFLDSFPIKVTTEYWVESPGHPGGSYWWPVVAVVWCVYPEVWLDSTFQVLCWWGPLSSVEEDGRSRHGHQVAQWLQRPGVWWGWAQPGTPARCAWLLGPKGTQGSFVCMLSQFLIAHKGRSSRVGSCTPPQVHVANRRTASPCLPSLLPMPSTHTWAPPWCTPHSR